MQQLLSVGCLSLAVKMEDSLLILKYNVTVATHSWKCCAKICLCMSTKHVFPTYTACTLLTHAHRRALCTSTHQGFAQELCAFCATTSILPSSYSRENGPLAIPIWVPRGLLILTITTIIALIILYLWTLGHEVLMVMPTSDMVTVGLWVVFGSIGYCWNRTL
jgi:hypothetical protein